MKYTTEQIEQAIDDWFSANEEYQGSEEFANDDNASSRTRPASWFEIGELRRHEGFQVPGIEGTFYLEEDFGGHEGGGEEMWIVLYHTWSEDRNGWKFDNSAYYRKDGFYSSYGESSYDGAFRKVERRQVTAIVYEEVK